MPIFENIEGPKLLSIISQLVTDKTLIKVSLERSAYESLTLVTETRKSSPNHLFDIDPPKGLLEAVAENNSKVIHFEFTSSDGVIHRFDALIHGISDSQVILQLPSLIQRHQQRDNFRVKTVFDSHATLSIDDTELRMKIHNVSLGGIYCYCPTKYKPLFSVEQIHRNMTLFILMESECSVVPIEQVRVNRMESQHKPKQFGMAFEFIRIKRDARKTLVQQIYELQRYILQNRLKAL
jgi:c-di-GMP-binding flagellar brake protein YcgR